jgi:hypothetical protein
VRVAADDLVTIFYKEEKSFSNISDRIPHEHLRQMTQKTSRTIVKRQLLRPQSNRTKLKMQAQNQLLQKIHIHQ